MTQTMMKLSLVIVALLVMFLGRGGAQSGCTTTLMSLTPCLNYVAGSSAAPSSSCCSQLDNVVKSNPSCLCSLLDSGGSSFGVSINQTLALTLPAQCKVQTPPVSQCNSVAEGPSSATSPMNSPIANEPNTPTIPPIRSESPASGPSPSSSPMSSTTAADEPETPNATAIPPIPAETTSKTVPSTKANTSRGTMGSSSFTITMLALFLSAFSSIAN